MSKYLQTQKRLDELLLTASHHWGRATDDEGNTLTIRQLLGQGANPNHTDEHGNSCLFYAAQNTNKKTVQLLVEKGASIDHKNNAGEIAFVYASKQTNVKKEVLPLLKKQTAAARILISEAASDTASTNGSILENLKPSESDANSDVGYISADTLEVSDLSSDTSSELEYETEENGDIEDKSTTSNSTSRALADIDLPQTLPINSADNKESPLDPLAAQEGLEYYSESEEEDQIEFNDLKTNNNKETPPPNLVTTLTTSLTNLFSFTNTTPEKPHEPSNIPEPTESVSWRDLLRLSFSSRPTVNTLTSTSRQKPGGGGSR